MIDALLAKVSALLTGDGVGFAIVGGLAVSARTQPRFTKDVDLAVSVSDDQQAESLVARLQQAGFRTQFIVEQEATGRLATVRLVAPGMLSSAGFVDLLFASSGIEREIVDSADRIEVLPNLTVPVVQLAALVALKLLARDDETRPQDRVDLHQLLLSANDQDRKDASRYCRLIEERGYARGRDLTALLAQAIASIAAKG